MKNFERKFFHFQKPSLKFVLEKSDILRIILFKIFGKNIFFDIIISMKKLFFILWAVIFFLIFGKIFAQENIPELTLSHKIIFDESVHVSHISCKNILTCTKIWDEILHEIRENHKKFSFSEAKSELKSYDALFDPHLFVENNSGEHTEIEEENTQHSQFFVVYDDIIVPNEKDYFSKEEFQRIRTFWQEFTMIFPWEWRKQLDYLEISHNEATAAFVSSYSDARGRWFYDTFHGEIFNTIGFNIDTYGEDFVFDILTLIHEFWHLFSLAPDQYGNIAYCHLPQTYSCYAPKSYMNDFYEFFWKNIDKEWIDKHEKTSDEIRLFYEKNKIFFINSYASGNPEEDFAESFTAFIMTPYHEIFPEKNFHQKILFFYQYPELVALRLSILENLQILVDEYNQLEFIKPKR